MILKPLITVLLSAVSCLLFSADLKRLEQLELAGNWKELREEARKQLDEISPGDTDAGVIWNSLCTGMFRGNEIPLYDEMFAKYPAGKFSGNAAFFAKANWNDVPCYGIMLDGKFKRGPNRGNAGRDANCYKRDRAQVLVLMAAIGSNPDKIQKEFRGGFYTKMSELLLQSRKSGSSYKLQLLTNLTKIPDYDTDEGRVTTLSRPPVNTDGSPVFYKVPESWESAANDGERLHFAVKHANCREADNLWADFLCGQFDFLVAEWQFRQEYYRTPAMKQYLYELKDNETIADLADGVRKLTLPEDCNYIELYKKTENHQRLGEIYASRMQFEKAAEEFEKTNDGKNIAEQIRGNWGVMEPLYVSPAHTELTVPYHFRNAKKVTVKLYRIDTAKAVDTLLKQMENPERQRFQLFNLAWTRIHQNEYTDLCKEVIAQEPEKVLTFDLKPLPHHWENTEYLKFGKLEPGAFIAEFVPDGNENSRCDTMIWAADSVLTVQEGSRNGKVRLFLNDPVSGKPVPDTVLKVHSFYYEYRRSGTARSKITPEILTFTTNADGIVEFSPNVFKEPDKNHQTERFILAETTSGKLTLLQVYRFAVNRETSPNEDRRTFMITDKTVYKPGDAIAFTGYLRQPSYSGKFSTYSGKTVTLEFRDPQYKGAFKKEVPFDEKTQSFTFETTLPADAMLGTWHVVIENVTGSTAFTVEEYKKPEYLLTVTPPAKPVKTGEKIPVLIEAKYYFGAPMPDAEISYKVFREETGRIYPFAFAWDWLYGNRYAVCTTSFQNGKVRNINYGRVMILNTKGKTDAQGKLTFEVDSSDALAKYGEKDFRYTVEAEVKDSTNRVVSGSGSVIAAVKPFTVSVYTPWGFAKTGERQVLDIKARTPNGEKVAGKGTVRIYRRALNKNGVPERTGEPLKTIPFIPDGPDKPEFILNEEGVYELEAEVVSENGMAITESVPVFVVGEKQGSSLFGEYPISISTDKPDYQPGDQAQILVTCDKPGQTIYFVTRSERGAGIQRVTLEGYSQLFTVPVEKGDQPNFFVNVLSCQDGKMLTLQKQIVVPPEKKVLNVAAKPAAVKVKPGTVLPLTVTVTDLDGKPVSGEATVTVYDKSLEAIHPSTIPAIRPFFWNWLRRYTLSYRCNFQQYLGFTDVHENMWRNMNIEHNFSIPFHSDEGLIRPRRYGRVMKSAGVMNDLQANGAMEENCADMVMSASAEAAEAPKVPAPLMKAAKPIGGNGETDAMDGGEDAAETISNAVRTNFLDRAFWAGRVSLPESGETTVNIPVPDNLTTWVIRVWSLTNETRVGEARTEIVVSKDLIARLELPRFLIQGDTVCAVVTVNNTTDQDLGEVETTLTAPGLMQEVRTQTVTLKANGAASYEVPLQANSVGEYTLTLSAKAGKEADALELKLPVLVKGIDKQVNSCGRLDAEKTKTVVTLDIPGKRRPETTAFALYLSPGAAKNMIELLPYLAADDSGDVFGVVNRFLPAISAKLALQKLGVSWEDAVGTKTARDPLYAEYMQRYTNGTAVPSFKAADYDRVSAESLAMIRRMVNSDGGWGWFGAYREMSWPDTTAYVVDALLELNNNEDRLLLDRGIAWLQNHAEKRIPEIKEQNHVRNTDCLVARVLAKASRSNTELMKLCYEHRAKDLSPYGYAMLALAYRKDSDEAKMLIRNLEQFLKVDDENGTAYLIIPSACCFFWYGNENETLAAYLELLLRDNPKSVTAQKVANYLVTNVRNSPWRNSTRSLGAAVRALANYISVSGEGKPDFTVTVRDGSEEHKYTFHTQNMWANDGPALFLPADKLKAGKRKIELEFSGTGALYWNGMLNYFSLEDTIEPAGLEMKIQRNYYLLVQDADASALLAGKNGSVQKEGTLKFKRVPLKDGDAVKPGDMVEVELISTAKNDYDYVVFQDSMPAGFEYVNPVSGWMWNWAAPMYAEYKERGAKFYLRNMARGQSNVFYRIRAQLNGTVTALPAKGYGIYAPELKCNSAQQTLKTGK